MLFDAHCHLQRLPDATAPDTWVDRARAARPLPVWGCAVCGCEVADWAQVEELHRRFPDFVVPSFGIHPWWAAGADLARLPEQLTAQLTTWHTAGVGECGLDGAKKKEIPMELQLQVLRAQLQLAKDFQRPVSLHCVAAHGLLLQALEECFPTGHPPGLLSG
ncbi:unnamed protein product, partial [Durusdinium trenchii]